MQIKTIKSLDGVSFKYAYQDAATDKPCLVLIIPFGLELELARTFFEHFAHKYQVLCWEARLILADKSRAVQKHELSVENHVSDLIQIMSDRNIDKASLVGFCSGAGIALAAVNQYSNRFKQLILSNGEYTLLNDNACTTQFGSDIDKLLPMAAESEDTANFILSRIPLKQQENIPNGVHMPFSQTHFFWRYAINYLAYRQTEFVELAKQVEHRTMLIAGEKDQQTNVASTQRIKELITNSEIRVLTGEDHYGILRPGSSTLQCIEHFLEDENI